MSWNRGATAAHLLAIAGLLCAGEPASAAAAPAPDQEPRFVFSTKGVELALWGRVKVDVQYDWGEFRYNDFMGPVKVGGDNESANFNPSDSRFGFRGAYGFREEWKSTAVIEFDFYGDDFGNNLMPRLRLGFGEIVNTRSRTTLRVGQDWTPIAQLNPSMIDAGIMPATGNLWWRVPQLTIRQRVGEGFELLVSAMMHRRTSTEEDDRMPWVLGRLAYEGGLLGAGNTVAIGGGGRYADYSQNDDPVARWVVAAEFLFRVLDDRLTFKGEVWGGAGIGRNFLRYDLDVDVENEAVKAWGGWVDVSYTLTRRIRLTAGAGLDDPENGVVFGGDPDRTFERNWTVFANAWYELGRYTMVGIEWLRVQTERAPGSDVANRIQLGFQWLL